MIEAAHQRAVNEKTVGCHEVFLHVIASEAKQSMAPHAKLWIASSLSLLAMTEEAARASRRHDLIADDEEFDQIHSPETRGQRHVGGVAPGAHQDAADSRLVVAGIECVPLAGQIDLEPAGEIHRRRI